jgi:hypothetical protein
VSSPSVRWLCLVLAGCAGAPTPSPTDPQTTPVNPTTVTAQPTTAPSKDPASVQAPAPALSRLANGMTVSLAAVPTNGEAQLQLGLLGGTDFAAPGVAELAAETLVSGSDASAGRPDLRRAIAALGGTVQVEVGPLTTWLTVRVPAQRWQDAHRALTDALSAPTQSRNQLERIRSGFVSQHVAAIWTDLTREAACAFLLGFAGTADHISALVDRDVSEITLFQSRFYRPHATLLSARVPGDPAPVNALLAAGIGAWQVQGNSQLPAAVERRLKSGIYWAQAPQTSRCRITAILPLPNLVRPDAADMFLLHSCLTLDGVGGRLEQLQREQGLGHVRWQSQFVQFAEMSAITLTAEVMPSEVVRVWQCIEGARRSLAELPPTASEYDIAYRRARLTAQLGANDVASTLRNQAVLMLRGISPSALQQRFDAIRQPGVFDAPSAAKRYLEMPAALIAVGGAVPADLPGVTQFELLPQGAGARIGEADTKAQSIAAQPWLDEALDAIGGPNLLARVDGFESEASMHATESPTATERISWTFAGNLQRTREILGGKIETLVNNGRGTERAGSETIELKPGDLEALQREMLRHPISLLAAHARGELQFRPIAQRNVGDRDLMILEAVGDRFDRLRVHVDTISHLIRVVESWETTADGAIVHLQEAWSDYRSSKGLRTPFRRITTQDDGQNRIETVYSSWSPRFSVK